MEVRVAIVGAGITGLSTAFHLAAQGADEVFVYDGIGVGSGASGMQPGGVRQQWGSRVNCLMARESYHFYCDLTERLGVHVNARLEPCGYLFVAHSKDGLDQLKHNRRIQDDAGVPSVLLSPPEAAQHVPGLDASSLVGAAFCAEDGYFDRPHAVITAFAEAAVHAGAQIISSHVRSLRRDGEGWSLLLADTSQVRADCVVVAAGCDTAELVKELGVSLPITAEARHLFYSDPIHERLLEPLVVSPERGFAAKQLADGSVLASDLSAGKAPAESVALWHRRIRDSIELLLPVLEYVTFPVHVEGLYDMTPDSQALLGEITGLPGLWVAAGFSGRGFMMAPAVGRFLAEAILDGATNEMLDTLSPSRFDSGSLVPESQVV